MIGISACCALRWHPLLGKAFGKCKITSPANCDPWSEPLQGRGVDGRHLDSAALEQVLDLTPYINTSAPAIPESFSLDRAYMMFRQLGLRHLVVVDKHSHVKGIITRKVGLCPCSIADPRFSFECKHLRSVLCQVVVGTAIFILP